MDAVAITLADVNTRTGKRTRTFAHRLHVSARREGGAGARQDHAAHIPVTIDAGTCLAEQLAVALLSQRISGFGPIDGERDQGAILFEQKRGQGFLRIIMVNGNLPLKWALAKSSINARRGILGRTSRASVDIVREESKAARAEP